MTPLIWMDTSAYVEGRAELETWARLVAPADFPGQPWEASLAGVEAAVATARYAFTAEVLAGQLGLKLITRLGVGYDNVDVEAATRLGICVTTTPEGSTQTVAEHTLALLLALGRRIVEGDQSVRSGQWGRRQQLAGPDLQSQTLGIVGLGRIGSRVAHMAGVGLGMRVMAHDPYLSPETIRVRGAEVCPDLATLLGQADIVTLHVPGTPETRHLIRAATLAQMKPGAYLVNTARGSVVSEADLTAALQTHHLAGAALDVFETEPPAPTHPLYGLPQVVVSPHFAGLSTDAMRRIGQQAARQVRQVLTGTRPDHLLNSQVWENRRR